MLSIHKVRRAICLREQIVYTEAGVHARITHVKLRLYSEVQFPQRFRAEFAFAILIATVSHFCFRT